MLVIDCKVMEEPSNHLRMEDALVKIARESWIIGAICMADLISTIWLVSTRGGGEGNPLMRHYLEMGFLPFILAKIVLFVIPVGVMEWARRTHPRFVTNALRATIILYICIYGSGVAGINGQKNAEHEKSAIEEAAIVQWAATPATDQDIAAFKASGGATTRYSLD